ncbi:AI-2E family transporter [Eubacterium sp. MSJ-13]|uniref:AI-2E family transporter n=1 Tax=Eubacterium sp. MSJ-13 TaxID=2841513 RepID=UPI001C117092|nr:AI-2E family transporter [Eubacterium sp. MSJ-13]MBU5479389.1 AI-2E family transporter [Eubacterium sp. MSJ-13]
MVDDEKEKRKRQKSQNTEESQKNSEKILEKKHIDEYEDNKNVEGSMHNEKKLYLLHGKSERETIGWFNFDKKYLKVCLYALFVIFWGAIIFIMLQNWGATKAFVMNFCKVLSPFFVAVIIAYFVSPLFEKIYGMFDKHVKGKKGEKAVKMLSLLLSYVLLIGFITVAFVFVIPQIGDSIAELTGNIPVVYDKTLKLLAELHDKYPEIDTDYISERLNEMVPNLIKYGTNVVGNVIPMVFSVSVSIVKVVINILLALIISVYMIVEREIFKHQGKRLVYSIFSESKGNTICKTFGECNEIFSAFLISKAIDSLIIGCLCFVIMNILHLPYTVLISVIVGITNMIPYFGPFIGAVPGVLIYLCTNPKDALIFVVMIFALQQFDGLILGPRLLGQSTGLSPIWVIFGITVGGAYFGVVGMFIGVPVVAVFAFLLNKIISYRLRGKKVEALEE